MGSGVDHTPLLVFPIFLARSSFLASSLSYLEGRAFRAFFEPVLDPRCVDKNGLFKKGKSQARSLLVSSEIFFVVVFLNKGRSVLHFLRSKGRWCV